MTVKVNLIQIMLKILNETRNLQEGYITHVTDLVILLWDDYPKANV